MNDFSMMGAWSLGVRFIAQHWLAHGLILILLGVAAPWALEQFLLDAPVGGTGAASIGPIPGGSPLLDQPQLLLVIAGGYALQTGSYFAALRLGFDRQGSLPGALAFGLAGGLVAVVVSALGWVLAEYAARPFMTADTYFLAVLVHLLPLILVLSLFFLGQAVMIAATLVLVLAFAMVYGVIMGFTGLAATMVGGDGGVAVLLMLLSVLLFWLAARMSCVTALMAERKSLNLFACIRDSWRLTWEEQWAVTRYLALVGALFALVVIGVSIAIGVGAAGMVGQQRLYGPEVDTTIPRLALSIPFAFLTVLLPAGIFRQLSPAEVTAAEIFD